jgi:hypothetical protein
VEAKDLETSQASLHMEVESLTTPMAAIATQPHNKCQVVVGKKTNGKVNSVTPNQRKRAKILGEMKYLFNKSRLI